jgi:hypothetical protein
MKIKMTLTFDNNIMETLRHRTITGGFIRPSVFARHLILRGLREDLVDETDDDCQVIRVQVDNYREIKDFVKNKKLGTVGVFANFAMAQYMSKYPPKKPPEREAGENIKD